MPDQIDFLAFDNDFVTSSEYHKIVILAVGIIRASGSGEGGGRDKRDHTPGSCPRGS